jgi:molecular chaperone DnaK (HSP70)
MRVFGIDLGTTNCAMAVSDGRAPRVSAIPQLVAAGEVGRQPTLPSFLYQIDDDAVRAALPWNHSLDFVAGVFARDEGALVPARQVASAKSWLANARVDRTAPLLPWGAESGPKLSPVEASARLLAHLRDAWNHEHAGTDAVPLEQHPIVLTVPASFDEEARELTADAARLARFEQFTLLEEPLAALYAWIAAHRRQLASRLPDDTLVLVCDVGGGTTDFSLVHAHVDEGELAFERTAIGDHLLLGGDNVDLALAALVEPKFQNAKLTLVQRQILRRKCSTAKEQLLSDNAPTAVPVTLLGSGRGVVGGNLTTELTQAEVRRTLDEFLPASDAADLPARDRRVGLRELGLPYETEPAITKHLAAFLTRSTNGKGAAMARPTAVLFNGGFFTPAFARERVLEALTRWFGEPPLVLENARPEAAVAIGAAFYARLRQDPHASRGLLIQAGSARSHYIGVDVRVHPSAQAVCVLPRGTQEGSRFSLDREFTVLANRPAAFTLYSSDRRADPVGALVTISEADEMRRHAPLVTALRYGKRSRSVPVTVRLSAAFTETGTLELWCESTSTGHRWRLAFNVRGNEALADEELDDVPEAPSVVIDDDAIARAADLLRGAFGTGREGIAPGALIGELENVLGHGKQAWPLATLRALADVLLEIVPGRTTSPAHEVRWLNLAGFCVRPGFGSASDPWRVSELRKVYAAGLAFPREVQNQVEWIVLWGRVCGGFNTGQQRELAQRIAGQLALGSRRPPRINAQTERESWRLLASLERVDAGMRTRFGEELLGKIRREPRHPTWMWSLGRLGARTPLYGPLNTVVAPAAAERWIDRLVGLKELTADAALTIAQIGARTGDAARDIAEEQAEAAADRLTAAGFAELAERLRSIVEADGGERDRIFGEDLPQGLTLNPVNAD